MSATASVVAVFGPTGSGKTDVAVRVAARLGTDVVNCDPAQCYRGLPVLTNQPEPQHDAIAPHRMVGVWELGREASFVAFARQAHAQIDELVHERGVAVACGGSGLYLQAAITVLPEDPQRGAPPLDRGVRAQLEARYEAGEALQLVEELQRLDPDVAVRVHPNDRPRVVRALEVALAGGSIAPAGSSHWDAAHCHPTLLAGLAVPRELLRQRIEARTRAMFDRGVLEEVASIAGARGERADEVFSHTSRRLHGLDDCLAVLRGEWSAQQAIDQLVVRTRQYAKRQDTWARRWPALHPVEAGHGDADVAAQAIVELARVRPSGHSH